MDKETSPVISTIASKYLHFGQADLEALDADGKSDLVTSIRALAGSALSQDETPAGKIGAHGIHPAPAEFLDTDIAADPILHFFHYAHLPPTLQETSKAFFGLAFRVIRTIPRSPERTVALRKLLEAKDAAVRANLPAPKLGGQIELPIGEHKLGETVEVGGHDEDRDGPIPFQG